MSGDQTYRINGFDQIKAFYSWVFNNQDKRITPQHISLYLFLINQNNRSNWVEWFKCPLDLAMEGSCIGNKKTYYTCINDLIEWKLIEYQKGTNEWKSPVFKLVVLIRTSNGDATVPQPAPLPTTQLVTLPTPLLYPIYKQLTDNIKLITDNLEEILIFLKTKNPSQEENKSLSSDEDYEEWIIKNKKEAEERMNILMPDEKDTNNPPPGFFKE
jgi:hypothetical protein